MITPEQTEKLYAFAQKLSDLSTNVIGDAKVDVTALWGKDPKVVALTLLSRALTNFKGTVIMLRERARRLSTAPHLLIVTGARMKVPHVRFNEQEDGVIALDLVASVSWDLKENPSLWKWMVLGIHRA
jgi:hypothetical protein